MARAERHAIQVSGLDIIPLSTTAWRKLVAFRTVAQKHIEGTLTQGDYIARWAALQNNARQSSSLTEKTKALWKMEALGVTYGRRTPHAATLADPNLPVEVRPISHVGMGAAAVERAKFDPVRMTELIESLANPDFHLFPYEQIGAMLAIYEKTIPRILLGLVPLNRPDPVAFIRSFPPEIQRLINHGYGRLLYFNSMSLTAAVRNIASRPYLDPKPAFQGMAFGYLMVNNADVWRVLETGDGIEDISLRAAFRNGLIYGLAFWEWAAPGTLGKLKPPHRRAGDLIEFARQEVVASQSNGVIAPFELRNSKLAA